MVHIDGFFGQSVHDSFQPAGGITTQTKAGERDLEKVVVITARDQEVVLNTTASMTQ